MAKFRTPYDTLLRVRRIEEDKAKAGLAEANGAERAARAAFAARVEEYPRLIAPPNDETDLGGFRRHQVRARAAAESVTLARQRVESAADQTNQARDVVRVASMRTQGLERLVDRAREERQREILTADQRTAEESATGLRRRARRAPRPAPPAPPGAIGTAMREPMSSDGLDDTADAGGRGRR